MLELVRVFPECCNLVVMYLFICLTCLFAARWWTVHGTSAKDLKKMAIRILSLTCSSLACERNWSAFERVITSPIKLFLNCLVSYHFLFASCELLNGMYYCICILGTFKEEDQTRTEEVE